MVPRKLLLMKTQRNDVFQAIQDQGLEPSEFRWIDELKDRIPMVADQAYVSTLLHNPTGYSFCFDMRGDTYWATFSPGEESPREHKDCGNWRQMTLLVRDWITNLKREVESEDLWTKILGETQLAQAAAAETDQSSFTSKERDQVFRGISEIKRFLLDQEARGTEQKQFISEKLDYLQSAVERMSKKDWLHTAMGVLFTIAIGVGLAPEKARQLFGFAADVFREIFTKLLH